MKKQLISGENSSFTVGLKYELGQGRPSNYHLALKAYRKAADERHYPSRLKIKRSLPRWYSTILFSLLSFSSIIISNSNGALWIGLLIAATFSLVQIWLDKDYYWYKPGYAWKWHQFTFGFILFFYLPVGTLLPYFNGDTYLPIIFLLMISFFMVGAFSMLWFSSRQRKYLFLSVYSTILLFSSVTAYFIPSNGVKFEIVPVTGGVKIVDYRVNESILTIPRTINSQPVVEIGDRAFANANIIKLYIGHHIERIGVAAFINNKLLKEVWIEDGVPLSPLMFANASALKEIRIPSDTTVIPPYFLYQANQISELNFSSTIQSIGDYAFYNNSLLDDVFFHQGLEMIGNYAFAGVKAIDSVFLPDSVKSLGIGAFANNPNLTSFRFSQQLSSIPDYLFENAYSLESFEVPLHIKDIGHHAFLNAINLRTINLHQEIHSIGKGAFRDNFKLESIILPNKVTKINAYTFMNNHSLTNVVLPSQLEEIGLSAFQNTYQLNSIIFPPTLTSIGTNAFKATPLETIDLPTFLT